MDFIIKFIHIIIVAFVIIAIGYSLVRNLISKNVEKEILNNPCYTEATIVDITPGTPSNIGIVSIHVGYRFTTETGDTFEKDDELINIKTMDLQKYQVGSGIPIVYARNEPSKNMLNMRDAMKDFKRK
ncbi:DUF3592 domain-containing protein [Serratia rubidaea]|uniref:DUF3592 domain-containing protein n=1 Tax=Serratia rubidaea TaxID=61652 RepID=A0A447QLM2_SERRU|nr:DUF3592 domain-containing protein [Serratia rubidaea]MBS0973789.1 hypothetical protein [Serratia rubidaea]VEA70881.1 Uncharacterised protein [Serratia rubidaea]